MTIIIDNKSGVPIYDQIYSQIKAQIIGDALRQDEALPSIRSLAKDLRISFITTKRAYEELEKRLGDLQKRGVVLHPGFTLRDLYEERIPLYEKYADIIIDENDSEISKIAMKIETAIF